MRTDEPIYKTSYVFFDKTLCYEEKLGSGMDLIIIPRVSARVWLVKDKHD